MVKYICKNCNYGFEGENVGECNFCGMESLEREKDACELIDEIENLLG
jgi:hypothetical protein